MQETEEEAGAAQPAAAAAAAAAAAPGPEAAAMPAGATVRLVQRTLCDLVVCRDDLRELLVLEARLRELRALQGAEHVSPLVGVLVRAKDGGRYRLYRVAALEQNAAGQWCLHTQARPGRESAGAGETCRRARAPSRRRAAPPPADATASPRAVQPPPATRPYLLPDCVSATNSLQLKAYCRGGYDELAELLERLGDAAAWPLREVAACAWGLKVARSWAEHLGDWLAQHGPSKLLRDLADPQGVEVRRPAGGRRRRRGAARRRGARGSRAAAPTRPRAAGHGALPGRRGGRTGRAAGCAAARRGPGAAAGAAGAAAAGSGAAGAASGRASSSASRGSRRSGCARR